MANTPKNIYLNEIVNTTLTTIATALTGETYTNLWLVIGNQHSAQMTFTIYHTGSAGDIKIAEKTIQAGKQGVVTDITGVKLNATQLLKIQSDVVATYAVDLSGSVLT